MSQLKAFKVYLVIYFFFSSLSIYFAIFTGYKIPIVIEILPVFIFLFSSYFFKGIMLSDALFSLAVASFIISVPRNLDNSALYSNYEVRGILFISINYFIFRSILRREWSLTIADTIINILKISMYLLPLEFAIINTGDIANKLQNGYLSAYPGSERLYEVIFDFVKPFGLYTGTHNAGIAATISLLYLIATKKIATNKGFFVASVLSFLICFSLTGFLTLVVMLLILSARHKITTSAARLKLPYFIFLALLIYFGLMYYEEITIIRSAGEISSGSGVPIGESEYVVSIKAALESMSENPFGLQIDKVNLFQSEVYLSRVAMFFGVPMVMFFMFSFLAIVFNLKNQNGSELIFSIGYLTIFISSFHYPSIISYPLNIFMPLAFVFLNYGRGESRFSKKPASDYFQR